MQDEEKIKYDHSLDGGPMSTCIHHLFIGLVGVTINPRLQELNMTLIALCLIN